jgi:hypothetical protein
MRPLVDVSDLNASFELLLDDDDGELDWYESLDPLLLVDGELDDCDELDVLDGELLEFSELDDPLEEFWLLPLDDCPGAPLLLDCELLEDGLLLDELLREAPYLLESLEYAELFVPFDDDADKPLYSPEEPCPD